jgi:hypothetical protein
MQEDEFVNFKKDPLKEETGFVGNEVADAVFTGADEVVVAAEPETAT